MFQKIKINWNDKQTRCWVLVFILLVIILATGAIETAIYFKYKNRIYPHVTALETSLGGLTREEAIEKLNAAVEPIESQTLSFQGKNNTVNANLKDLGIEMDKAKIADQAYNAARQENWLGNTWALFENTLLGYSTANHFKVDADKFNEFVQTQLEVPEESPVSANLVYQNNNFTITPSKPGKGIDSLMLAGNILDFISNPQEGTVIMVPKPVGKNPDILEYQLSAVKHQANAVLNKDPEFWAGDKQWQAERETLASFLKVKKVPAYQFKNTKLVPDKDNLITYTYYTLTGISPLNEDSSFQAELAYDEEIIRNYLIEVAPGIEQAAINARLGFSETEGYQAPANSTGETGTGEQIIIVEPSHDRIGLDIDQNIALMGEKLLEEDNNVIELKTFQEKAPINEDNLEELGLKTLIARGDSNFSGSPKNRRHNIAVGASKFDGVLIAPGEEFSFLTQLGPVDASTGYLPELVIKANKTVPEYGGGMCQVSSTAFRGAVYAGFEIVERRNHAYPVNYYSPQGTDATVYIPSPDLKFVNNTPGNVLIQTSVSGNYLTFEYYGTYDGRSVELEGPISYDRSGDGAMKAKWMQKVFDSSGTLLIDKTFLSKYDSPNKYPHPGEEEEKDKKKDKKKKKKKKD